MIKEEEEMIEKEVEKEKEKEETKKEETKDVFERGQFYPQRVAVMKEMIKRRRYIDTWMDR